MTPQMKQFIQELADLLAKHDVELEAVEDNHRWTPCVDGIECTMTAHYTDDSTAREYCEIRLPKWIDNNTLKDLIQ